ncbi:MAG TPA: type II toxin-antitoxin system VapC family toxin [Acidimicrobiales bacterium]
MVDASVLVQALGDDGDAGNLARQHLRGQRLAAPELIDLEIISAWRKHHALGRMTAERSERARADLQRLPLQRISHRPLASRCWELRDNLTPYDAAYVAVAELFGATLVTADVALARAPGPLCCIELLA